MKKDKKIPKSFMLGAMKFKVEIKDKVKLDKEIVAGSSDPFDCTILIAKTVAGLKCSKDFQRQTFYHELVHQILNSLGELELSSREKLVQRFSLLLDQFEETKKF